MLAAIRVPLVRALPRLHNKHERAAGRMHPQQQGVDEEASLLFLGPRACSAPDSLQPHGSSCRPNGRPVICRIRARAVGQIPKQPECRREDACGCSESGALQARGPRRSKDASSSTPCCCGCIRPAARSCLLCSLVSKRAGHRRRMAAGVADSLHLALPACSRARLAPDPKRQCLTRGRHTLARYGNTKKNVAPSPGALCAQMRPPWRSMMR